MMGGALTDCMEMGPGQLDRSGSSGASTRGMPARFGARWAGSIGLG